MDERTHEIVKDGGVYPKALIEDLYAVSFHLMRNFELAPYANDTKLEDFIANLVDNDKI